jgi:hypothetical protein
MINTARGSQVVRRKESIARKLDSIFRTKVANPRMGLAV